MAWDARSAAELTQAYLDGRWTTGVVENCTRPEHEQTVFRADGTFATEQSGKALAVGFWRIEDDRIDMQILTTEASLPQALQDQLPGDYHALRSAAWCSTSPTTPFVWCRVSRASCAAWTWCAARHPDGDRCAGGGWWLASAPTVGLIEA